MATLGDTPVILVVDDEAATIKLVQMNLIARGYQVLTATDGEQALQLFTQQSFDLVLLDILMPGPDGFQICQLMRRLADTPIIMLSARGREQDKVMALDLGADDYLTKPFGVEELLARVRAALRRGPQPTTKTTPPTYRFGEYQLDQSTRRLLKGGDQIKLTPTEFSILSLLVRNSGKVLTHQSILRSIWGSDFGTEDGYLWTYIRRLRKKMGDDARYPLLIATEPGIGYRFIAEVKEELVQADAGR